eukprot:824421-Ditylum_brightwellii.AAC.2
MHSKEEILQSKGNCGLLHICLEKFDGEVKAFTHSCKNACSPMDMSSKEEIYAEQRGWMLVAYLLGEV